MNGTDPVEWSLDTAWADNLGALFTYSGQSESIYSTSTVETSEPGTTTIDYWAQVPGAEWLHIIRNVVIFGKAPADMIASTTTP